MARAKITIFIIICSFLPGCLGPLTGSPDKRFEQPETGVYGVLSGPGMATDNSWVYAYRSDQGGFRGPAEFAARAEDDGRYLLDLLPGRWFLVARSRLQGPLGGPPQSGDGLAIYQQNPLLLQPGQTLRIDWRLLPVNKTLLRGKQLSHGDTGFSGRLLGPDQKPAVDAVALAYRGPDFQRMPEYSSAAASADGRFILYVRDAGRYCLVARQKTRGEPRLGELYGRLGADETGCRQITAGQLLDVGVIHLKPFLR